MLDPDYSTESINTMTVTFNSNKYEGMFNAFQYEKLLKTMDEGGHTIENPNWIPTVLAEPNVR